MAAVRMNGKEEDPNILMDQGFFLDGRVGADFFGWQ
jgi:hypothetical protein